MGVALAEDFKYDLTTKKGRIKHYLNVHFRRDARIWAMEMLEPFIAIRRLCKGRAPMPQTMQEEIVSTDVWLYVMDGCGYCERTRNLLESKGVTWGQLEAAHSPVLRHMLKESLNVPMLTFPVVFVKGMYIGGFDQLFDLHALGQLQPLLELPFDTTRVKPDPLNLTVGPRGQTKCEFQLHIYGNWIRFYEGLHVILGLVLLALGPCLASTVISWMIFVD